MHYVPKRTGRRKHFADYVVFVSLAAVLLYTLTCFVLQFVRQIEPSPTLTTCFFSFFGAELASLAVIKYGKSKHVAPTTQEVNSDGTNY